jgi:ribosomal protein S18 acetylase RimI-like enzyme
VIAADLTIRDIDDADVVQVVELWGAAGVSRPWNNPLTDIAFARQSSQSIVLVGVRGQRIVATVMVGEDGHRGWAYYLATHPDVQRQGIARQMMSAAEGWLKARGIWKMQLLIRADNGAAKDFYEKLGYQNTQAVCFQKVIAGDPMSGDARERHPA